MNIAGFYAAYTKAQLENYVNITQNEWEEYAFSYPAECNFPALFVIMRDERDKSIDFYKVDDDRLDYLEHYVKDINNIMKERIKVDYNVQKKYLKD